MYCCLCSVYGDRDIKMGYSNFRATLKNHFCEWNWWKNFLNNMSFLVHMKNWKYYTFTPPDLQPPKLIGRWPKLRDLYWPSHLLLWSSAHMMSYGKIRTLYFHFYKTCSYHHWHSFDLGWSLQQIHMLLRTYGLAMSRDKMKTLYLHFCNSYKYWIWRSGTLGWEDPTYQVSCPLIMLSLEVAWENKKVISPLHQNL